jgi:olefin beta-lactone synthetase
VNLASLLLRQAAQQPHAPALVDYSGAQRRALTFGELAHATGQAAALLHDMGLRPGDRVLVFHPMSAELYVALGALFRLGLVALFIDPGMGRAHIDRCCARANPQGLLATPKAHLLRLLSPQLRRIPVKFATGWGAPGATRWAHRAGYAPHESLFTAHDDSPALATFTSGSTGAPKLAVRTHGFLQRQHEVLERTLGIPHPSPPLVGEGAATLGSPQVGEGAVVLTTLPIFVLSHLASGVCTVIPDVDIRRPGAVQAGPILRRIQADGVTCLEGSPAFLARLAETAAQSGQTLPRVRQVFTGGAPVFPTLLDAVQRIAPHAQVTAVYGSTEAEPIAHITRDELAPADRDAMRRGNGLLTGCPVPEIQARILPDRWGTPIGPYTTDEFAATCLAPEAVGEIVVSGDHVLPGYWQGEGDAESKFRVIDSATGVETIWHRTGDAGKFDTQGRLWLLGRCSARITDDRGVLYPFAVECAATEHPAVRQAALVQVHGRRVLALALHQRLNPAELESLRDSLAWAHVDEIRVLPSLPVDPRHNAKIDYTALRRRLDSRAG